MRVEGYVCQIVAPKDHGVYFGNGFAKAVKGKYVLTINRKDVPRRWLSYFPWYIKHHKEFDNCSWNVIMDECPFKEGQDVSLEVKAFLPLVEVWTEDKKTGL
jgi:hypothetical protein